MKHLILPTDFTIQSLQPLHQAIERYPSQKLRVTLLHLVQMPDAIGDLLFARRRNASRYPIPASFTEACDILMHRYENYFSELTPLIRPCETAAYLNDILLGIKADCLIYQEDKPLKLAFHDSVDMKQMLRRVNLERMPLRAAAPAETRWTNAGIGALLMAEN